MSSQSIQHVTDLDDYKKIIGGSACIVKFTANWCGPCKRMAPMFDKISKDLSDHFKCLEVDIDVAQEVTNFEDVKSIPLFVFYINGARLDNLSLKGANEPAFNVNIKSFMTEIAARKPKEPVPVENSEVIVTPPTQGKTLDMSRLTLDNVEESDNDEPEGEGEPEVESRPLTAFEPEYDSDENHNDYGEEIDDVIEKTIPEDMINQAQSS